MSLSSLNPSAPWRTTTATPHAQQQEEFRSQTAQRDRFGSDVAAATAAIGNSLEAH